MRAHQSYSQSQGGQGHGQHYFRYRGLNMDGSTHPINTNDPTAHHASDTGDDDGREGGYVPPDIVTSSAGPLIILGASSEGSEMELPAITSALDNDNVAVALDLYAALTSTNTNASNAPTTNISSV